MTFQVKLPCRSQRYVEDALSLSRWPSNQFPPLEELGLIKLDMFKELRDGDWETERYCLMRTSQKRECQDGRAGKDLLAFDIEQLLALTLGPDRVGRNFRKCDRKGFGIGDMNGSSEGGERIWDFVPEVNSDLAHMPLIPRFDAYLDLSVLIEHTFSTEHKLLVPLVDVGSNSRSRYMALVGGGSWLGCRRGKIEPCEGAHDISWVGRTIGIEWRQSLLFGDFSLDIGLLASMNPGTLVFCVTKLAI